jgi:peptidylprolyl isomerase
MEVQKGNKIKVQYTGKLKDGTIFDKSKADEPLEFSVGSGKIIPGFDKAVEGMKLNEEKKVILKPEEAYGKRDKTLIKQFPKSSVPEELKPEKGMVLKLQDKTGRSVPATIIDMTEDNLVIDLNHPLAGRDLTFDIKIVDIE